MTPLRPSVAEERWLAVAPADGRAGGWKTSSPLRRAVFFVLGLAAAILTGAFVALVGGAPVGWFAALALLAAAEWLIVGRRLFASGIEEALELSGLSLMVYEILGQRPDSTDATIACCVAAVTAFAGLRLLNPLFTTLSALALSFAIPSFKPLAPALLCFALATLALAMSTFTYRRPSHDRMLGWLVVVMPPAGCAWLGGLAGFTGVAGHANLSIWLLLGFALAALGVGIARRNHAPLLACLACSACLAYELRHVSRLPVEARLLVGGGIALALAVALDRYLRTPRHGWTSRQVNDASASAFDLLQMAGVATLASRDPQSAPAAAEFRGGGGGFSGGGAGGDF